MLSDRFGQYLISRRILTPSQFLRSVDHLRSHHLRLGEIALQANLMSQQDVQRAKNYQKQRGVQFGEAALQLGVLTKEQLEGLLARQQANRLSLADAVLELGFVPKERLLEALSDFSRLERSSEEAAISVPLSIPLAETAEVFFALTHGFLKSMWNIDSKIGYVQLACDPLELEEVNAAVHVSGDVETEFYVGVPRAIAKAGAMHRQQSGNGPVGLSGSVGELTHTVAGAFAARMVNRGLRCLYDAPREMPERIIQLAGKRALKLPLWAAEGHVWAAVCIPAHDAVRR